MIELDELEEPEVARAQLRDFGLMGPHKYAG